MKHAIDMLSDASVRTMRTFGHNSAFWNDNSTWIMYTELGNADRFTIRLAAYVEKTYIVLSDLEALEHDFFKQVDLQMFSSVPVT